MHLSGKLLHFIQRLREGLVQARYLAGGATLHAKIYLGEEAATLGSSNFTEAGLRLQLEANARFSANQDKARYAEMRRIAENYWAMGRDYGEALIALQKLLRNMADHVLLFTATPINNSVIDLLRIADMLSADNNGPSTK